VAVAVGDATEIGRISGMLSEVESLKTPLMQRLDAFTKVLSIAIIALAAFTFAPEWSFGAGTGARCSSPPSPSRSPRSRKVCRR
jgi:magnesium-transporting ATPase (P-type)